MLVYNPPEPAQQLAFLKNIQRLLDEGSFVASYKFALLHALADLAIVKGDDTGAPLQVSLQEIAEKFIELYWQQVRPFHTSSAGFILKQNTGPQASIVNALVRAHRDSGGSLYQVRRDTSAWNGLVRLVGEVVWKMPLRKLQTIGSEQVTFLYDRADDRHGVVLKPGVAWCFRAFYPMLTNLFRSAWMDYVRRFNYPTLGHVEDLREFMFGGERIPLARAIPVLRDIQCNVCLYCGGEIRGEPEVDHFIPWSRCRSDLAHNLVLAHKICNSAKSDHLACEDHLGRWTERNRLFDSTALERLPLTHDIGASARMAHWAYYRTMQAQGQVWISRKVFRKLDPILCTMIFSDLEAAIEELNRRERDNGERSYN